MEGDCSWRWNSYYIQDGYLLMKKQPYPIVELTGGLNVAKDAMFILDKESPELVNVRIHEGMIKKDLGYHEFGTGLPLEGIPSFMETFYLYDGSAFMLMITTLWIYYYDETLETYHIINPPGGASIVGGNTFTFDSSDSTITASVTSFATAGFVAGDVIIFTGSILNNRSLRIESVSGTEITVEETLKDETVATGNALRLAPLSGTEDDAFSFAQTFLDTGQDVFFLTNGIDPIMYWTGDTQTFVKTSPALYARRLAVFTNRLFLGFVIDLGNAIPTRVQWSCVGDPLDFSGTGSGWIDLVDTIDWITGLVVFRDRFYVVKERSIWELVNIGGTTYFSPALKLDGVGSYAANSVISLGEQIMFFGNDNVYLYNGMSLDTVGDNLFPLLYDTEKKIVNSSWLNRATALYVEELAEYWIGLPTVGERTAIMFKYNFQNKAWVKQNMEVTALGYYLVTPKTLWEDLVGDWAAQDWIWMERVLPAGAPTTLIGTADGYIWEDDRVTTSTDYMEFQTKDWVFAHAQRWVEIHVEAMGGDFFLSYSTDSGKTWSEVRLFTGDTEAFRTYVLFINETSDRLRCKVASYAESLVVKWIEPWYIPRVRAKILVSAS